MKALYCHNNVYLHAADGKVYADGQFPYDYWTTFLKHFDTLTVLGRRKDLPRDIDPATLNLTSGSRVNFATLPIKSEFRLLWPKNEQRAFIRKQVESADIVIIRAVSELGWHAYRYAKKSNKAVAMEMAACSWDSTFYHENKMLSLKKPYALLRQAIDRHITKNADGTIYVSQNFLQKRYPAKNLTAVASNVRIKKPQKGTLDKRIEKIEHFEKNDSITLGLIGQLHHDIKGIDIAIKAMSLLKKYSTQKFTLNVLGSGEPERHLALARHLNVQDRIIFTGRLPSGAPVMEWLDNIDIYIQPSRQEGVPRGMIEAMSRGCPALGSKVGGIPELLPKQCLHPRGDYKTLATQLLVLSNHPEIMQKLAGRNFEVSKNYNMEKLSKERAAFWSALAKNSLSAQKHGESIVKIVTEAALNQKIIHASK